jgi:hypothetical protein
VTGGLLFLIERRIGGRWNRHDNFMKARTRSHACNFLQDSDTQNRTMQAPTAHGATPRKAWLRSLRAKTTRTSSALLIGMFFFDLSLQKRLDLGIGSKV